MGSQTFSVILTHRKVGDMLTAPGDAAQFGRAGFAERLLLRCWAGVPEVSLCARQCALRVG